MDLAWLPSLLEGTSLGLIITGAALMIGLPLGVILSILRRASGAALRLTSLIIIEIGRGLPLLVILYLVYFGLPELALTLSAFTSAVFALAYVTAAYTSEIFRAGIESVPRGIAEAAAAVGMTSWDQYRFVILPPAIRRVIAPLISWGIALFQGTSLAYAISVQELMARAYIIGSSTFKMFDVLLMAAIIYAIISIPLARVVTKFEVKS